MKLYRIKMSGSVRPLNFFKYYGAPNKQPEKPSIVHPIIIQKPVILAKPAAKPALIKEPKKLQPFVRAPSPTRLPSAKPLLLPKLPVKLPLQVPVKISPKLSPVKLPVLKLPALKIEKPVPLQRALKLSPADSVRIAEQNNQPIFEVSLETQERSYCGRHALNNIFQNYYLEHAVPSHYYFSSSDLATSDYTIININRVCSDYRKKLVDAQSTQAGKKQVLTNYSCYEGGDYAHEVLMEAINRVPWARGDVLTVETQYREGGRKVILGESGQVYDYTQDQINGLYYDAMIENFRQDRSIMGYLVANNYSKQKPLSNHYICIIPRGYADETGEHIGLIFIDSLNTYLNPTGKAYPLSGNPTPPLLGPASMVSAPWITKANFKLQAEYFSWIYTITDLSDFLLEEE